MRGQTRMNSYLIKTKEVSYLEYFVDGNSIEEATEDLMENWSEYNHNGMGDEQFEVLGVEVCGTNIERNKEGRIIKSEELTKENSEHNKKIGGTIL